jgi:hypothetical protein
MTKPRVTPELASLLEAEGLTIEDLAATIEDAAAGRGPIRSVAPGGEISPGDPSIPERRG